MTNLHCQAYQIHMVIPVASKLAAASALSKPTGFQFYIAVVKT